MLGSMEQEQQKQLSPEKAALKQRFWDMVKGITDAVFEVVLQLPKPPERPIEPPKPGTQVNILV